MARRYGKAIKIWFRLLTGVMFFALLPHKASAVEHPAPTRHGKISHISKQHHPTIRESADAALQQMLEQQIQALSLNRAVRDKRLAVALVDVTNPDAPSLAQINGDEMMYAASLPKIAILLAAFERIAEGKLPLDENLRNEMAQMIRYSSNRAATSVLNKVGDDYVNTVLTSPKYRLYDPAHNGGLWVGKEYSGREAFHRDPLHQLSHGATATQVARYYYLLETGQLVSPKFSTEMKNILARPGISHKFVKGLQSDFPDVAMYRKSGTWRHWHADSALVEHDGHRYIAVALANDPHGGEWMKQLIRRMDDIIVARHAVANLNQDTTATSAHADLSLAAAGSQPSSSAKHLM